MLVKQVDFGGQKRVKDSVLVLVLVLVGGLKLLVVGSEGEWVRAERDGVERRGGRQKGVMECDLSQLRRRWCEECPVAELRSLGFGSVGVWV